MLYGFNFPMDGIVTAVCAADDVTEFAAFVEKIREEISANKVPDFSKEIRVVELFEYFAEPILKNFAYTSPTIMFTHETAEDQEAFLKAHGIEMVLNQHRGFDRQSDMLFKEEQRIEDEANKGKTIGEITGLVDGADDPWDQRSEAQKERDAKEKAEMQKLKDEREAKRIAANEAAQAIIEGRMTDSDDEPVEATPAEETPESIVEPKTRVVSKETNIVVDKKNDTIEVDVKAITNAKKSSVEVKSAVDIMNEVIAENPDLLDKLTSDDLASVLGGGDPTSDAMGVGDGQKFRREQIHKEKEDFTSELSDAAKELRRIYQEKLAENQRKENEAFEAERDEQEKEDAANGIFHGADLVGELEDIDGLEIAEVLKKIAEEGETKVEHVKYPYNSVIGENIFIPHIPQRIEATDENSVGIKVVDEGQDIVHSDNLKKVGQLTLGTASVMVVAKVDADKPAWVVLGKPEGKARKVVHIR